MSKVKATTQQVVGRIRIPFSTGAIFPSLRDLPGWITKMLIGFSCLVVGVLFSYGIWELLHIDRIYPGVTVAGYGVGRLQRLEAQEKLADPFTHIENGAIVVSSKDRAWEISPKSIGLQFDATATAKNAHRVGRSGKWFSDFKTKIEAFSLGVSVPPVYAIAEAQLAARAKEIAEALESPAQSSRIEYVDGQFIVTPSLDGVTVDQQKLIADVYTSVSTLSASAIQVPLSVQKPALTADQAQQLIPALTQYEKEPLTLTYEGKKLTLDMPTLLTLIDYESQAQKTNGVSLSNKKLNEYIADFAKTIDRPSKDALFRFEAGRASAFQPSQDGLEVDRKKLTEILEKTLLTGGTSRVIEVPVKKTQAKVTTESVNDLGIRELLATGESNYRNSPADRIFNIELAASRINGVLIAPDQEFSFNNAVGEIAASTGYKQALVILSGRTVLGDGGGVCQVSTTVFRAALEAGLPITARTAHAFRVSYYENDRGPGFDATIYQPGVDFKFKNDTGHYILLQTRVDKANTKLYIDLYGTSDGRQAVVSKATIHSTTPPPPESRIDDPNLPKGQVKQVEKAIPGAKVSISRTVTRNGETIISETFRSNFRAWQAVFLVGTKEG